MAKVTAVFDVSVSIRLRVIAENAEEAQEKLKAAIKSGCKPLVAEVEAMNEYFLSLDEREEQPSVFEDGKTSIDEWSTENDNEPFNGTYDLPTF